MTKAEAKEEFISFNLGTIPPHDGPAIAAEWAYFIDTLNKDGRITDKQAFSWLQPSFGRKEYLLSGTTPEEWKEYQRTKEW